MAEPATVLHQKGGTGVVVFAGQDVPAAAIRADTLHRLHELARLAIECTKTGQSTSADFRGAIQELHLEIATLMLHLQDSAFRHDLPLPVGLKVGSEDFVYLEESEHR